MLRVTPIRSITNYRSQFLSLIVTHRAGPSRFSALGGLLLGPPTLLKKYKKMFHILQGIKNEEKSTEIINEYN